MVIVDEDDRDRVALCLAVVHSARLFDDRDRCFNSPLARLSRAGRCRAPVECDALAYADEAKAVQRAPGLSVTVPVVGDHDFKATRRPDEVHRDGGCALGMFERIGDRLLDYPVGAERYASIDGDRIATN